MVGLKIVLCCVVVNILIAKNEASVAQESPTSEHDLLTYFQSMEKEVKAMQTRLYLVEKELQTTKLELEATRADYKTLKTTTNSKLEAITLELEKTRSELQLTQNELQETNINVQSNIGTMRAQSHSFRSGLQAALDELKIIKLRMNWELKNNYSGEKVETYADINQEGLDPSLSNSSLQISDERAPDFESRLKSKMQENSKILATERRSLSPIDPNERSPNLPVKIDKNGRHRRDRRVAYDPSTKVAFSVNLNTHQENLGIHQTVIFDTAVQNEGTAYDTSTGVFTCPKSGLYYFSVTIMVFYNEEFETELVVNSNRKMLNYAAGNQRDNQATNSVVVRLNVGDRVWVRIFSNTGVNNGNIRIYGGGWSTFTGFMI